MADSAAFTGLAKGFIQAGQTEQQKKEEEEKIQTAKDWEAQKRLLNSQQDFAHEMRLRQAELDREARAKEWYNEKLELASRVDFEQNEKERLRRKSVLDSGMETIINSDAPEGEKAKAQLELKAKYMDVPGYENVLGYEEETGLFNFGNEEIVSTNDNIPGVPTDNNPLGLNITEGVSTPISTLSQNVLQIEQENKFEVISPDGKQETISAAQWPDYKSRGYVLSQIKRLREKKEQKEEAKKVFDAYALGAGV